jgi:hypothetical protein
MMPQIIAPLKVSLLITVLALILCPRPVLANDYPTPVIADYVIGCMASNGETQDMMQRCSCSIDAISSVLTYDVYEKADTIMQLRLVGGDNTSMFREMPMLKKVVDQLRLAQIEADFRCF